MREAIKECVLTLGRVVAQPILQSAASMIPMSFIGYSSLTAGCVEVRAAFERVAAEFDAGAELRRVFLAAPKAPPTDGQPAP